MTSQFPPQPRTLAEVWPHLQRTPLPAAAQVALRRRLLSLQIRTAAVDRQTLLMIESLRPLRAAGWWMPELAELVGADLVGSRKGEPPAELSLAQIAALAPDVIVVAVPGQRLSDNAAAAAQFAGHAAAVYAVDAVAHFTSSIESLVESAEILAELLHQDSRLQFGHGASRWRKIAPLNPRYPQA